VNETKLLWSGLGPASSEKEGKDEVGMGKTSAVIRLGYVHLR
jgi:hypothetical protein